MSSSKKVSIIIPTFNRLELLKITLDNLFRQSTPAHEIIVVDDHSTDGTFDYLTTALQGKVIALHSKGKGPGAARNTGLARATGEYIKFFDSDDLMTTNTLAEQSRILDTTDAKFVYSPYVHTSFTEGTWQQYDVVLQYTAFPKKMTLADCMAYGFFMVIPGMLFRKELLEAVGAWREDLLAYENWDYLWRIAAIASKPAHTNACAMLYRFHGAQTTEGNSTNNKRDYDKQTCLGRILRNNTASTKNQLLLRAEWWKTEKRLTAREMPRKFRWVNTWKRIRNKYERHHTKTNWERMHGPCADPEVFEKYLTLL